MKSVPLFLKGPFRNALKFALEEVEVVGTFAQRCRCTRGHGGGLVP